MYPPMCFNIEVLRLLSCSPFWKEQLKHPLETILDFPKTAMHEYYLQTATEVVYTIILVPHVPVLLAGEVTGLQQQML